MEEQEKQIEEMRIQRKLEMTKDISNGICGVLAYEMQKLAEHLISLNYVKLPENSVVLSREEYEKIYEQAEANVLANIADGGTSCHWCIEQHEKKASKEAAEKIYKEYLCDILSLEAKEEFAKQFGVEMKEN